MMMTMLAYNTSQFKTVTIMIIIVIIMKWWGALLASVFCVHFVCIAQQVNTLLCFCSEQKQQTLLLAPFFPAFLHFASRHQHHDHPFISDRHTHTHTNSRRLKKCYLGSKENKIRYYFFAYANITLGLRVCALHPLLRYHSLARTLEQPRKHVVCAFFCPFHILSPYAGC